MDGDDVVYSVNVAFNDDAPIYGISPAPYSPPKRPKARYRSMQGHCPRCGRYLMWLPIPGICPVCYCAANGV